MNRTRCQRSRATGFAAVALVVASTACGGSSKNSSTPTTAEKSPTTTAPATTTTTQPDAAADKARAQSLVLVTADLPAEWTGKLHQKDPSDVALDKKLSECVGSSDPATETASVDGYDFDLTDAEASSSASMAADHASYERDIAALRGPKVDSCLKTLFASELQKQVAKESPGTTISDLVLTNVASPTYGDVTVASRLTMTIANGGNSAHLFIDSLQYGQDRAEVTLTFSNVNAPFDPVLEKALIVKAVTKLKTVV